MQGEYRDCKHYMGSYMGCEDNLDVEEHRNLVHPVTRAHVKKRLKIFGHFLGDTASSADIRALSFN
jgi:hypothetical protein